MCVCNIYTIYIYIKLCILYRNVYILYTVYIHFCAVYIFISNAVKM